MPKHTRARSSSPHSPSGAPDLVDLLGGASVDLDYPDSLDTQDMQRYIVNRLSGISEAMDADVIMRYLTEELSANFLLARLVSAQLRDHPVDTNSPGWENALQKTAAEALDADLARSELQAASE